MGVTVVTGAAARAAQHGINVELGHLTVNYVFAPVLTPLGKRLRRRNVSKTRKKVAPARFVEFRAGAFLFGLIAHP